jgi:hypothetical protein
MYLLYIDESGNPDDPADRYFVIGGVAVFERVTFYLSRDLERLQDTRLPGVPPVEFHAAPIRSGTGFWRPIDLAVRNQLLDDIGQTIARANQSGLSLFAAIVEKDAHVHGEDAVKLATEQVCKRFDTFLTRRFKEHDDPQRGLIIFAESHYQKRAKVWVRGFRELGTQWGILNNLSDIPSFARTKETRLLQLADFVAHAVFLLYERRNPTLAKMVIDRMDQKDGVLHGLVHCSNTKGRTCDCPACFSRRNPYDFGPWLS